jgi:prevent-host-death family protein
VTVQVGIRDFRENLREWLDRAEAGEEVLVTDRGRPKVRVVSAPAETTLERLTREGLVRLPTMPRVPLPPPIPVEGSPVTDAILEQRSSPP